MNIRIWISSSRPPTWIASIAPMMLAVSFTSKIVSLNVFQVLLLLVACLSMQIACNFTNDYFDDQRGVDDHSRQGPQRGLQQKLITHTELKRAIWICYGISISIGFYFSFLILMNTGVIASIWILLFTLFSAWTSYAYTGGKYPLGYHGLGDLAAFIFFGPGLVSMLGFILIHASGGAGSFDYNSLLLGLSPGFFSVSLLNLNNLRDLENDCEKGKKTLAVLLGRKKASLLFYAYLSLAITTPLLFIFPSKPSLNLSLLCLILFLVPAWQVFSIVKQNRIEVMNQALKRTALIYLLHTACFCTLNSSGLI